MTVEILTPEKIVFNGSAMRIQLPGVVGLFEVLDDHAPMISALKSGRIKLTKDKNSAPTYYDIRGGFVEVIANTVTVLAEGAEAIAQ